MNINYKKLLNKYKINILNKLSKKSCIHIYIRYNHIDFIKLNQLKKDLIKTNSDIVILKKNLIQNYNKKLPLSSGPICLVTTNSETFTNIYDKLSKKKNLEVLFVKENNQIYSKLKLHKILQGRNLPFQLKKPLILLSNNLKQILIK